MTLVRLEDALVWRWIRSALVVLLINPLAASVGHGQPAAKIFTIGYLSHSSGVGENEEALREGLREIGYAEGRNLVIEWRFARGDLALHPRLAATLASLKVDCIITVGVTPTRAAMQATRTIPIVMANASVDHGVCVCAAHTCLYVWRTTGNVCSAAAGRSRKLPPVRKRLH